METLSASDAKREFGDLILKAQQQPVGINKNGKPVAVMLSASAYAEIERMREQYLQLAINEGLEDIAAGRVSDGRQTLQRLRALARDGEF